MTLHTPGIFFFHSWKASQRKNNQSYGKTILIRGIHFKGPGNLLQMIDLSLYVLCFDIFMKSKCSLWWSLRLQIFVHFWIHCLQLTKVDVARTMSFFYVLLEVVLASRLEATYRTQERCGLQVWFHVPLQMVFLVCPVITGGAAEIENAKMAFLTQMSFWGTPELPGIVKFVFPFSREFQT